MAKRKSKKSRNETPNGTDVVAITISRVCAEELYIAIAKALSPMDGGKGKGGGGKAAELAPPAAAPMAGGDDTGGYD